MKQELKHSLSVKLLRMVLLSALAVGAVLGCAQIVFDAYETRQAVANDAERILDMFRDPSTQAVYSLDHDMAMACSRTMPYARRPSDTPTKPSLPKNHAPCTTRQADG